MSMKKQSIPRQGHSTELKRGILLAVEVLLATSAWVGAYSGGTGEPNDPYLISTAEDMNGIGADSNDWDKHFLLVADINLADYTGTQFNIIGNDSNHFTGVFDGNGRVIYNFNYSIDDTAEAIGIFSYLGARGQIKSLSIENLNIDAPNCRYVGGLTGINDGTISCCNSNGKIVADEPVGGLVGRNNLTGYIENSSTSGQTVEGYTDVGGIVGLNFTGIVSGCSSTVNVNGDNYVGGVAGGNWGQMYYCSAEGQVQGNWALGGLVGLNWGGYISRSAGKGNVLGEDFSISVGGLVGDSIGTVSECFAFSEVVSGHNGVGGLIGNNSGSTLNSYAICGVMADNTLGGLIGRNTGFISNCYVFGYVDCPPGSCFYKGGLVGEDSGGTYNACIWYSLMALHGAGNTDVGGSDPNGMLSKQLSDMKKKNTYTNVGWDFVSEQMNGTEDFWTINETNDFPKHVWTIVNFVGWYEIDMLDFAFFANRWMYDNCGASDDCDGADIDFSDTVDADDLKIFCDHWLEVVQ